MAVVPTAGCRQRITKKGAIKKMNKEQSDQLAPYLLMCETVDDNVKALIYFYYFQMNGIRFIAALPAPVRVGEGGRQRLHLLIEIKSGLLFLNDQIDSLAPEGFLGNEAE